MKLLIIHTNNTKKFINAGSFEKKSKFAPWRHRNFSFCYPIALNWMFCTTLKTHALYYIGVGTQAPTGQSPPKKLAGNVTKLKPSPKRKPWNWTPSEDAKLRKYAILLIKN